MQTRGTFPGLYSGQSGGHPYGARGQSQSPNPILPPKRRRQLVMPQPKIASNPLGAITANPGIADMVGRALNVK